MRLSTTATVIVTTALAACAPNIPRDENSPYFAPPVGSQLILKKAVAIKPNEARAYFQHGEIVPRTINYYEPHCQLEVNDVLPVPQTVKPGTFTITAVSQRDFDVVQTGNTRLASGFGRFSVFDDDGVSNIMYAWQMRLTSAEQPNVRALICGGVFAIPVDAERPTINEMRQALGNYAEIRLAPATDKQ
jgi:hypothetical protein